MRQNESGDFLRLMWDFKKYRKTKEGMAALQELRQANAQDIIVPPIPHETIQELERQEIMKERPPRVNFATKCPHCGRINEFSILADPFAIMGTLGMKMQCPCGEIYLLMEHVVRELPWMLIITILIILGILVFIILAFS